MRLELRGVLLKLRGDEQMENTIESEEYKLATSSMDVKEKSFSTGNLVRDVMGRYTNPRPLASICGFGEQRAGFLSLEVRKNGQQGLSGVG